MKQWKIKRLVIFIIVIISGSSVAACQNTPDEAVVVDKSEGLPSDSIIDVDNETPKNLRIPSEWTEVIDRQEGYVTITADCKIDIPEIYNTPVWEYEMKTISDEKLKELCDYFAEGNKLYEEPLMTKEQLRTEKEEMLEQHGFFRSEVYEKVDELLENAPDKTTYKYVDPEFKVPYQTEYEKICSEEGNARSLYSDFYYETTEKIGFKVRVAKGQEVNPQIKVINANEEIGSTTNFVYSQGTFVDEVWLEEKLDIHKTIDYGEEGSDDLERLKKQMEEISDELFSKEEAISKVETVLSDLSLEGYTITACHKALGDVGYDGYIGIYKDDLNIIPGYSVYLSYKVGDLCGFENPFERPFDNLPEQIYAPAFSTEEIHMVVTKEGVQLFEWTNISEKTDVIAENTKLCDFEKIKEKMADHMLYKSMAALGDGSKEAGDRVKIKIKSLELRAVNVPAFENPEAVWLVPAWVFVVEEEWVTESMGTLYMGEETLVLNAIDGGYVRPRIDMRIPIS